MDVAAPPERVFAALTACELVLPKWHWRALFGVRVILGRIFGWDGGLRMHPSEPLVPGNHYCFFRIEHVTAPHELGLSVENKLTLALVSLVVTPAPFPSRPAWVSSRLFSVTCSAFKGGLGRAYWRVIRPFHDAITEDSLAAVRRRAENQH